MMHLLGGHLATQADLGVRQQEQGPGSEEGTLPQSPLSSLGS
jgi:hypothetical protein